MFTQADEIPTHQQLKEMPYVLAIIKESQRLYPSLAQPQSRRATSDFPLADGRVIQKGTMVVISILQINRDPKAWPEPDSFNPDRFMQETISTAQGPNYMTFSYGKRICLGMQFSIVEQRVILSMLLNRFKWKLADPNQTLKLGSISLALPGSLRITFEDSQMELP